MNVVNAIDMAADPVAGLYIICAINGSNASAVISGRLAQEPLPPMTFLAGEFDYGVWPVTDTGTVLALESGINERPILNQTNAAIIPTRGEDKRVPLSQPIFVYLDHMMQVAPFNCLLADPLKDLDVSIPRDNMLAPVLEISNAEQANSHIRFVEGTHDK
jgi:hypothetical protein